MDCCEGLGKGRAGKIFIEHIIYFDIMGIAETILIILYFAGFIIAFGQVLKEMNVDDEWVATAIINALSVVFWPISFIVNLFIKNDEKSK